MAEGKCRECGGQLTVIGTGDYGDAIEVECRKCGEFYEIEPDGLDQGGMEFVDAQMIELDKNK